MDGAVTGADRVVRASTVGDCGIRDPGGGPPCEHRPCSASADAERGSGTVLVLGIVAVVLLLGMALAALGAAQQARGTAQAAADLGALAGATALRDGYNPCAAARAAVERNHGSLAACESEGDGVVGVTVMRASAGLPGWVAREAKATARAGPRPAGVIATGP